MPPQFNLAQKTVVIAGGTGGLGNALRNELVTLGSVVTTISRAENSDPTHITADLRSPEAARLSLDKVIAQHGVIDVVINAMGVVAFGQVQSTSVDTIEELFLSNTFAHIFLMQAALEKMTRDSVLVGISGVIAEQNLPGMAVYGASKAAVRSFNEALAREARRVGVRVIDARPPHTETGLASRAIAGTPPNFPTGLDPLHVARRIIHAIANGETDLPATSFQA